MDWITDNSLALLEFLGEQHVYALIYIPVSFLLLAVLFLPCSPIVYLSAIIFGPWIGGCLSIFLASLSFVITYIMGSKIEGLIPKKHRDKKEVLKSLVNSGWVSMLIFYANPVMPGSSMGYIFGLAKASPAPLLKKVFFINSVKILFESHLASGLFEAFRQGNSFWLLVFGLSALFYFSATLLLRYYGQIKD